jgi:hypothetical protein
MPRLPFQTSMAGEEDLMHSIEGDDCAMLAVVMFYPVLNIQRVTAAIPAIGAMCGTAFLQMRRKCGRKHACDVLRLQHIVNAVC